MKNNNKDHNQNNNIDDTYTNSSQSGGRNAGDSDNTQFNNIDTNDTNNTQSSSTNNNNNNNTQSNTTNTDNAEAYIKSAKALEITDININIVYIVLLSQFLNLKYLYIQKNNLLNQLNGVNTDQNPEDSDQYRILAREMVIFASLVSIGVDIHLLNDRLSQENIDFNEVANIRQTLVADVLLYLAAKISESVLFSSIYPT